MADLSLDKKMLQEVLSKNCGPALQRVLIREVQVAYRVAKRRVCRVLGFSQTTYRSRSRLNPRAEFRVPISDMVTSPVHYGHQLLWVLLRREGRSVTKKLVCRPYREKGQEIPRRQQRRRNSGQVRGARSPAGRPMRTVAWTSWPISWRVGSDPGC